NEARQPESRSRRQRDGGSPGARVGVVGRRALARRVALMVVESGLPLVGVAVSRIPGVQACRETLKSRRVCETRIGLPGRLAPRRPGYLINRRLVRQLRAVRRRVSSVARRAG